MRQQFGRFQTLGLIVMSDFLEALLWCAALGTWLMLLFAFVGEHFKSIANSIRLLTLRLKAKW